MTTSSTPHKVDSIKLKRDILLSYLSLSGVGVIILLVGLFSTLSLRDYALHLIEQTAPRVEAVEKLQKGLEISISNLRAWMAFNDKKHTDKIQTAWLETIYPALTTLQTLEQSNDGKILELRNIKRQLNNLEMWQWHIKDVVHTPGNFPGRWIYNSKIAVLVPEILSATAALLDLELGGDSASMVLAQRLRPLRTAVFESASHLKTFLYDGPVYALKQHQNKLAKANANYQDILSAKFAFTADQRDQLELLSQSLNALKFFAQQAITKAQSNNQNVANFWLNQFALPAVAKLSRTIAAFSQLERQQMTQDVRNIQKIAYFVPWLMTALLLLMVLVSVYLAKRRTQQFIKPVLFLEKQEQLKTELAELNNQSYGVRNMTEVCQRCLNYIAQHSNAAAGAIFITSEASLKLTAGYAVSKNTLKTQQIIAPGEGLVGQVFSSKQVMSLTLAQDKGFTINTSLLEVIPGHLLIAPILYDDKVIAVLELASLQIFSDYQREFIDLSLTKIAIILNDVSQKQIIEQALSDSLLKGEELQTQQTQLTQSNENLVKQTQLLIASEEELRQQTEELKVSNEELHEKQEALQKQKHQIEMSQKDLTEKAAELALASQYKSEFLANMSHELRTPLNSLLLLAKSLADNKKGNLDDTQVEDAQIIHQGGRTLLTLINDILDLSKVEAGKLSVNIEKFTLVTLANNIQKMFDPVASAKGLQFTIEISQDAPKTMISDGQRLEQILRNLLSNAMKFTEVGAVRLHIFCACAQTQFNRRELNANNTLCLSVTDTGMGIREDKLQAIFEAFQQQDGSTSRKFGGTGLGLTIARELSAILGGEIQLHSQLGQGSTFTLLLPFELKPQDLTEMEGVLLAVEPDKSNLGSLNRVNPPAKVLTHEFTPQEHKTPLYPAFIADDRDNIKAEDKILLVIDDDKVFARILYDFANKQQYKCLVAGDGRSGIYLAQQYQPNGIVLDIRLPDIDGHEVLDQLKFSLKTRHIPVEIISAHSENKAQALQQGAIGLLVKPVSENQLKNVLTKISDITNSAVRKILIIEDDQGNRHATTKLLQDNGLSFTCVQTGKAGCAQILSGEYDCVILDLGLPDMNGFEVLEHVSQNSQRQMPPFIIYTGREISDEEQAQLEKYSSTIVIKGVGSAERLLDDVSLFLHNIDTGLSKEDRKTVRLLHDEDRMLQGRRVLIVDDDMRNIYALSKQLIEIGLDVDMANNGKEALELLEQDDSFELVLMDTMMPEMDGNEATLRIRQMPQYQDLPIIALTAKTMPEDREKCLQAGASEYLTKPIDFDKLLSILRIWLFKKLG